MVRTVPTLVFLHGIQSSAETRSAGWEDALQTSWAGQQLPWALQNVATVEPRYNDLLASVSDEDVDPPPPTSGPDDARRAKIDFEVRRHSLARLLGADELLHEQRTKQGFIPDPVVDRAIHFGGAHDVFGMVEKYRRSPGMRHRVLHRVLEQLDGESQIVIIAHSLGSVIAVDLLSRLPTSTYVERLITIGSPLGRDAVVRQWNARMRRSTFPHHRLGSWLNVWSPYDLVCAGRPVDHPAVVNYRADVRAHGHRHYLAQPTTSLAVGEALFGNPSRDVIWQPFVMDRDFAPGEAQMLRLIQAGRVLRDVIDEDDAQVGQRFGAALEIREQRFFDVYRAACTAQHRAPHPELARAMQDPIHVPSDKSERDPDTWVDQLVDLLRFDYTEPAEIDVEKFGERFASEMASRFTERRTDGVKVYRAVNDTRAALKPRPWLRYVAAAAGVAMLAAATGGVGLVAAPGLAGAAALTSGLAAFGPGGMLGGLFMAGGLASAGSASLVASLMHSGGASAEETIVQLNAQALARQRLGKPLVASPEVVVLEVKAALHERLETGRALSDRGAKSVKRDEELLEFCDRALAFIAKHHLGQDSTSHKPSP